MEMFTLHFDGSCGPKNPGGTAAYGFALERQGEVIENGSGIIGTGAKMTNNLAEFTALARGLLCYFAKANPDEKHIINVYGDSKLVINMMNGIYRPNKEKSYYPGYLLAKNILSEIRKRGTRVTFDWIPRERNSKCDELSKLRT